MDAKRHAEELASRCVALVVYHQHARTFRSDRRAIQAEFRAVVAEARECGTSPALIAASAMGQLLDRYEVGTARRLYGDYLAVLSDEIAPALIPA